ncbi:MAG: PepSY-associated TM helix domain-containing protein, partial [Flavisolibacter sp.]
IFLLMIITGIVLWWPKNRRAAKHGFAIMWRAHPKRLNYDLHKVLGFYAAWIVIFTVITGLIFAFEGFADFTYRLAGSNHSIVQKKPPLSDTTVQKQNETAPIDLVWKLIEPDLDKKYTSALFVLPASKNAPLLVRANPEVETLFKTDFRYFDQYTGREIPGAYVWGQYKAAHTIADNIKRMNYDIHTGAILGLPGRIALFFAALIAASLPITGFYFWWGKKQKAKKSKRFLSKSSAANYS